MASLISFVVLFSLISSGIFKFSFSKQVKMTIKTKHDVYDCIDFYEQPAFNHPLLRNLTFKEKRLPNLAKLQRQANRFGVGFKDGGCPIGTVPILRLNPKLGNTIPYVPATIVAAVQTRYKDVPSKNFNGVSGSLSLWRPRVDHNDYTTSRIKLKNGGESIEAGWRVYPDMYGNNESHLYVQLLSKTASCVAPCSPFVHVSGGVPLGMVPDHYSLLRHDNLWVWDLSIDKHQDDGNWWLSIVDKKNVIGYWPKLTLTYLRQPANQVDWGGETVNLNGLSESNQASELGTGRMAYYNYSISATIFNLKVVNRDFQSVEPEDTTKVWNYDTYTVLDGGNKGGHFGRMMYFGGPWDQGWNLGK